MNRGKPLLQTVLGLLAIALLLALNGWFAENAGGGALLDKDKVFHLVVGLGFAYVFYYLVREKQEPVPHHWLFGAGLVLGASGWFPIVDRGFLYTALPDWDIRLFGIGSHRNPIFHSAFFPILLLFWALYRPGPRDFAVGLALGVSSHLVVDLCQSATHNGSWFTFTSIVRGLYGSFAVLWMLGNAFLAAAAAYGATGRVPLLVRWDRAGFRARTET